MRAADARPACARSPTSSPACSTIIPSSPTRWPTASWSRMRETGAAGRRAVLGWARLSSRFHQPRRDRLVAQRAEDHAARSRHRDGLERQQRVRDLGRGCGLRRLRPAVPAGAGAPGAGAADEQVSRETQSAQRPNERPYVDQPRRRSRHRPLRPDLVRRQLHRLEDAALEPAPGSRHEPVRPVQHRPRRRRLPWPEPGAGAALSLRRVLRAVAALRDEFLEGDGVVTLPWMYPDILPQVHEAYALRYRLLPHIYAAMHRAAVAQCRRCGPLGMDFPDDARAEGRSGFSSMLGDGLLVAPVLDQGVTTRTVYLPQHPHGWYDFPFRPVVCGRRRRSPSTRRSGAFRCLRPAAA